MTGADCLKLHCLLRWQAKLKSDGIEDGLISRKILLERHAIRLMRIHNQIEELRGEGET